MKKSGSIGFFVYIMLISMPLFGALILRDGASVHLPEVRQWALLANSLKIALTVTALDLVVGFFCALFLFTSSFFKGIKKYYFLFMLPIPFYVYALSWMNLLKCLAPFCSLSGIAPCIFVEAFAFLPISILFHLIGMESVDCDKLAMAQVYANDNRAVWRILLPSVLPYEYGVAGLICILSITEFSVPSMFQYTTFALDLFSEYSRTGSAVNAYLQSVPLILLLVLPVSWLIADVRHFSLRPGRKAICRLKLTGSVKAVSVFAFCISVLQIVFPILVLIITSGSLQNILACLSLIEDSILTSFSTALCGGALCAFLASLPIRFLEKKGKIAFWILAVYTIVIPGAVQATGFLKITNSLGLIALSRSILQTAIGCALYFVPFLVMWIFAARKRMDRRTVEMADVLAIDRFSQFRCKSRLYAPVYVMAFAIAFFLTFAQESIPIVLMAPGLETVTVKIYNYLHYGASEYVSAFSLIVVITIALMEGLLVLGSKILRGKIR